MGGRRETQLPSRRQYDSDIVAVVEIISGGTEHYSQAVYETKIVTPFKGATAWDIISLGPFIGCDYGIKLNTSQVILPKNIKTFRPAPESGDLNSK